MGEWSRGGAREKSMACCCQRKGWPAGCLAPTVIDSHQGCCQTHIKPPTLSHPCREEMEEALEAVGLQMRTHQCKKMVKSFIKVGAMGCAVGQTASHCDRVACGTA